MASFPTCNGHPLSGVVTRTDIVDDFASKDDYFNTFGGNPVSCAAGLAVLEVLEEEDLQQNALEVGQTLVDGLRGLAQKHEAIGDVRGSGFFIGLELVDDREQRTPATALTKQVVNDLRNRGLLTGSIGPDANILKLRCPMVLSRDDANYALEIIDASLAAIGHYPDSRRALSPCIAIITLTIEALRKFASVPARTALSPSLATSAPRSGAISIALLLSEISTARASIVTMPSSPIMLAPSNRGGL
jgi:hypothetical protein